MCHTSDICVLCMVTSVTWSWPWTELNIKHLLNQCLALYFRSTRGKFWTKTDSFEVSTARNLKAPILTFDLTLTWHVTSFGKFRGCFRIDSSRAFERRIVRPSAAIRSRVMTWGRLTPPPPPPPASRGWRSTPANDGLNRQLLESRAFVFGTRKCSRKLPRSEALTFCYLFLESKVCAVGVLSELLGGLWTRAANPASCLEMSNEKIQVVGFFRYISNYAVPASISLPYNSIIYHF